MNGAFIFPCAMCIVMGISFALAAYEGPLPGHPNRIWLHLILSVSSFMAALWLGGHLYG